jgi:hypothetical protein
MVRPIAPLAFLAVAGFSGLAGCINTDTNIFVAPTVSAPSAALVTSNPLGLGLAGSFELGLDLAPRASGASTVTLGQVSLVDAAMTTSILPALSATASPAFPVVVQPGSDPTIAFTFDTGTALLPTSDKAAICAAAGVAIEVEIQDSLLEGMSKAAYSPVFDVSGCM